MAYSDRVSGIRSSSVKSIILGLRDRNFSNLQSQSTVDTISLFSPLSLALIWRRFSFSTPRGVTRPLSSIVRVAEQIICQIPPAFVQSLVNFSSSRASICFCLSFLFRFFSTGSGLSSSLMTPYFYMSSIISSSSYKSLTLDQSIISSLPSKPFATLKPVSSYFGKISSISSKGFLVLIFKRQV